MFGLARIGKDVEVRFLPSGDAVCNLALAFNYGKKGDDGKRPTQWVDAAMFGARAQALAPFLLKGGQIAVTIDDVHIETYQSAKGEGSKLVGRISDVELVSGGASIGATQQAPTRQPAQQQAARPSPKPAPDFTDMDDDIPFILCGNNLTEQAVSRQLSRSKLRTHTAHANRTEF